MTFTSESNTIVIDRVEPVRTIACPLGNDSSNAIAAKITVAQIVAAEAYAQIIAFICLFFLFVVGFSGGGY